MKIETAREKDRIGMQAGSDGSSAGIQGRVLVVEDDERNRRLLVDVLTAQGYEVSEAENGEAGLKIAGQFLPDVVLLDLMMPDMDGFEVCRRFKADSSMESIFIIIVTALDDRKNRLAGIDVGANDYLAKPIDTRDLTLRVRNAVRARNLYVRLQKSYERLREVEQLDKNLVEWIVHDMRNPLGVISGNLQLLRSIAGEKISGEERECFEESLAATRQLLQMTYALLDVNRMEEGKMPVAFEPYDLREAAASAIADMKCIAENKGIEINLHGESVVVSCDWVLLSRVFYNLIDNAVKYTPGKGHVTIRILPGKDWVRCEVEDEGPGIAVEHHRFIFEKFGRVDAGSGKRMRSTGLGLAFCKLAVDLHGGRIGVVSDEESNGSIFWFEIPVQHDTRESRKRVS